MRILAAALLLALAVPLSAAPSGKGQRPPAKTEPSHALPLLPPATGEITVPMVLERFERFDAGMNTMSGEFRQSVHSQDTGQSQTVTGTLAYRKKDRLRVEHLAPESQTLVCDGSRVWVWRPANGQVIRSKLDEWKRSQPLAQGLLDFGNYAGLLKRYDVSVATVSAPGPDGHRSLALALKPLDPSRGDFRLVLRLSTRDFFPFDSELRVGAVTARTTFSDIRFNPDLPESQFQFRPPPGADVLDFPASPR